MPSAVKVMLPVNNDIVTSAIPMQARVITDCRAARCPLLRISMLFVDFSLLSALFNV